MNCDDQINEFRKMLGFDKMSQEQIDAFLAELKRLDAERARIPVLRDLKKEELIRGHFDKLWELCSLSAEGSTIELLNSYPDRTTKYISLSCSRLIISGEQMDTFREAVKSCSYFSICPHTDGQIELCFYYNDVGRSVSQRP